MKKYTRHLISFVFMIILAAAPVAAMSDFAVKIREDPVIFEQFKYDQRFYKNMARGIDIPEANLKIVNQQKKPKARQITSEIGKFHVRGIPVYAKCSIFGINRFAPSTSCSYIKNNQLLHKKQASPGDKVPMLTRFQNMPDNYVPSRTIVAQRVAQLPSYAGNYPYVFGV